MSQSQPPLARTQIYNGRFQRFDQISILSPLDGIILKHPVEYHSFYFIQKQDMRQYFQVFANFVKESIIDNERKPRILALPFPSLEDRHIKSTYEMIFTMPQYIPVKHQSLNYLHVWITDEDGHSIEFVPHVNTHISLHFRKQNPYK